MSKPGKRTVWVAGFAVLVVIAFGIAWWPAILTRYHLYVLQTKNASFPRFIGSERTRSQERALRIFLKMPTGRRRLFECCLDGMVQSPREEFLNVALDEDLATELGQQALREAFLAGAFRSAGKHAHWAKLPEDVKKKDWDKVIFGLDLINGVVDGVSYEIGRYNWHVTAARGGGGGGGSLQEHGDASIFNIIDLLKKLQPGSFPVSGHPHLECKIDRKGDRYVWCQVLPE